MATGYGATAGYDYRDYYGNSPEVPPEQRVTLKNIFGALGGNTAPVSSQSTDAGGKMRALLGLAPLTAPTAAQADVRKLDNAIDASSPEMVNFGAVRAPTAPAAAIAGNSAPYGMTPVDTGVYTTAGPNGPVTRFTGAAADAERAKDIAASLAPRTNAPAAASRFQAAPGSLASFFGAAMNMKRDAATASAAQALGMKLPEIMKTGAETAKLTELNRIAAAEPDLEKRRLILSGLQASADRIKIPLANQPTIGADKNMVIVEDGVPRSVPIRQQGAFSKGSDGRIYLMGTDGKPLREATEDERTRMAKSLAEQGGTRG